MLCTVRHEGKSVSPVKNVGRAYLPYVLAISDWVPRSRSQDVMKPCACRVTHLIGRDASSVSSRAVGHCFRFISGTVDAKALPITSQKSQLSMLQHKHRWSPHADELPPVQELLTVHRAPAAGLCPKAPVRARFTSLLRAFNDCI